MKINIKGADYSALGLGNIRWIEQYITNYGITNTTHQAALRALYTSYIAAGFVGKFEIFQIFFNANADKDKANIISPDLTNPYQANFVNDIPAAHTLSGYQPTQSVPNRYFKTGYKPYSLSNFHIHAWNTTPEITANKYTLGVSSTTTGNIFALILFRGFSVVPYVSIANANTIKLDAPTGYPMAGVGLLSGARVGSAIALYDEGVKISSNSSQAYTATPNGTSELTVGTFSASSSFISDAKLFFWGCGVAVWTDTDETNLRAMLGTFKTAIGA